jgi:hypothetical protein
VTESAPQLEYGRATPLYRSSRWWTKAIVACLLVVVAILLVPRYLRHTQLLYWQRHCLTHHAPPDRVIFENDPEQAQRLLNGPDGYDGDVQNGAFLFPTVWRRFYQGVSGGLIASSGTAFLGERVTPAGQRVLVAVDLFLTAPGPNITTASFGVSVVTPGTSYRRPHPLPAATAVGDGRYVGLYAADRFRVFAGQRDAADGSHFTIEYDLNGKHHTLDGWLEDDQTVKIEIRE